MTTRETSRLLLRPFDLSDVTAFFRLGSDPQIIRYVGNTPFPSVEAARDTLEAGALHDYQTHGYGRFACVWKETGEVIGFSGLKFIEQIGETELGYRFVPEFWGLGLATEAGQESIAFARELELFGLIGLVDPENKASAHVLSKLGFQPDGKQDISFWHAGEYADRYSLRL